MFDVKQSGGRVSLWQQICDKPPKRTVKPPTFAQFESNLVKNSKVIVLAQPIQGRTARYGQDRSVC
jgi:hypothetical protein